VAVNYDKSCSVDLHETLAYVENPVSDFEISDYLFSGGYEVFKQGKFLADFDMSRCAKTLYFV